MYCVKRFREMNFSVISRGSWSRGKGPATSCQEFHFKLVDLGNKERQRSMTGRRMLHPFRGWNFYPTINSKEETQFSRSRKIIRLSSQVYIYMYVRGMYIFDCLKTFQWNSWEVYESWIYIDRTSDKTRTRYRQEAISRTYRISYFAITTRHLRRRPRFFHFTIFQKRS